MKMLLGLVLLLVTSMVACSPLTPDETPETPRELLSVEWRGGLCQYGGCTTVLEVSSDGSYRLVEGDGRETSGSLAADLVGPLSEEIEAADFDAARAQDFAEICPTAYDGQEVIYTFHARAGDERLSTCEYVIEWDVAPFPQALAVLEAAGR